MVGGGKGDFWVRPDCAQVLLYPLNVMAAENLIQIFDPIHMSKRVWAYEKIFIDGKYSRFIFGIRFRVSIVEIRLI